MIYTIKAFRNEADNNVVSFPIDDILSHPEVNGYAIYMKQPDNTEVWVADYSSFNDAMAGLRTLMSAWAETHHEIVVAVNNAIVENEVIEATGNSVPYPRLHLLYTDRGIGGIYDLCIDLTTEFESSHNDWNAVYFDALEEFIQFNLK